jgi:single-stranded-DNA-specific exonuclease
MVKKWLVAKKISEEQKSQFPEIHPIALQLLYNRGLQTQSAIDEFLHPDYGQDIHDPFLFRDMEKAVARIFQAIENGEKITIHGDYDADGVSATVIAASTLLALGAEIHVHIPHRSLEGYGLSEKTVEELVKNGTKLIVTVDCGIASQKEVALAKSKGIDVIVTDHHEQQPELPAADAIINPQVHDEKYPFKNLAGSGVAFKLAHALAIRDGGKKLKEGFEKWLLDLVALGTIADCMPILGENRTLVKYGLIVLRKTRRLGIQELAKQARITLEAVDTNSVGFTIGPRLNAAGRLEHANTAYRLLLTEDLTEAETIAKGLEKTNQDRQRMTEKIVTSAKQQIGDIKDQKILFALGKDWIPGIVGLVAGRLTEEYSRPVLIMGEKQDGEIVGSGRSIPSFNVTKALIECRSLLDHFGGHEAACGFSLAQKNLEKFKKKMIAQAEGHITEKDMVKSIVIDTDIHLKEANWELVELLNQFEPFGEDNRQPRFVTYGLTIVDMQKVGRDGKHLKLVVKQDEEIEKIIAFGIGNSWGNRLKIGDVIDVIFELSVHEWNGNRELQLKLIDIKSATA